jgi:hypothetical protein
LNPTFVVMRRERFVGGCRKPRSEASAYLDSTLDHTVREFVPILRALRVLVVPSDLCGAMRDVPDGGRGIGFRNVLGEYACEQEYDEAERWSHFFSSLSGPTEAGQSWGPSSCRRESRAIEAEQEPRKPRDSPLQVLIQPTPTPPPNPPHPLTTDH